MTAYPLYISVSAALVSSKKHSLKLPLRIALIGAALASTDQRCTVNELAKIVGCDRSTIRRHTDLCDIALARRSDLRSRISKAIEMLLKSNQRLTYPAIAAAAGCAYTSVQKHRDLWEHIVPRKNSTRADTRNSDKAIKAPKTSGEVWRMHILNLLSLNNESLLLNERKELIVRLCWFASFAPTPTDAAWCNEAIQSVKSHQPLIKTIAS